MSTETAAEIVELEPQTVAVIHATVPMGELTAFYDRAYGEVFAALGRQGVQPVSAAFGRYFGEPGETVEIEAGIATDREVEPDGEVRAATLPGGRAARAVHVGGFDGLGESWRRLADWIGEQGEVPGESMWEEYVTEPSPEMDPEELRTVLVWPLA